MVKVKHPSRFDVFLVNLDPVVGSEIRKTRPCVVISPDEINRHLRTFIIAPMTSSIKNYPTRIPVTFKGKKGNIVLDQIRTVDQERLVTCWGILDEPTSRKVCGALVEMFSH